VPPIKRATVQVHHGFDLEQVRKHTIDDSVRETVEVELTILFSDFTPAFGIGNDAAQGTLKLIEEVVAQARLPFLVSQRGAFQFFVGFRMADDAHEACIGRLELFAPPGGKRLCLPRSRGSADQ